VRTWDRAGRVGRRGNGGQCDVCRFALGCAEAGPAAAAARHDDQERDGGTDTGEDGAPTSWPRPGRRSRSVLEV
jgi:hypothetical protein